MKQDLISFWRYAFNSGRNTSRQQFLHSFYCFVVPFLIFLHFNGAYQSNQNSGFSGGIVFGLGFTITNLYAGLVYGVMMIPIASLYISSLRTNVGSFGLLFGPCCYLYGDPFLCFGLAL